MYKLIVCDLDETLLNTTDKKVSQANRDAIKRAKEAGVRFVVGTGRPYPTVQGTLKEIGLKDQKDQYIIGLNGGMITENAGNRILYRQGITFEEAVALFNRAKEFKVGIHIYTGEDVFVWNFTDYGEKEFLTGRMEIIERNDDNIEFLRDTGIIKILYFNCDFDYIMTLKDKMTDLTGDMDVSFSSSRYIEFNRKGVTKGVGLKRLADILGIDMADTIAIGDNFNDLSMIQAAGLGVGVSNSAEDIKPYCDYITKADCDHGAVAEVIDKFIFGKDI